MQTAEWKVKTSVQYGWKEGKHPPGFSRGMGLENGSMSMVQWPGLWCPSPADPAVTLGTGAFFPRLDFYLSGKNDDWANLADQYKEQAERLGCTDIDYSDETK